VLDGESAIAPEQEILAIWTVVAENSVWRPLSHHSCPIRQRPGLSAESHGPAGESPNPHNRLGNHRSR
jgi:hypothetical protein